MFDQRGNIPIEVVPDPKTGETIHRVAIDPKLCAEIDKTVQNHQGTMNQFVMNSQQFFLMMKAQFELMDKIKVADDDIKKTLTDVQKKSKLDPKKPWAWNLHLKSFEYRSPPIIQGMSQSEVEKARNPGHKPHIVNKSGVGA